MTSRLVAEHVGSGMGKRKWLRGRWRRAVLVG